MHRKLEPKLLAILREGYTRKQFQGDLAGGLTVGIVALPLPIALAIASGVKPEQGLYTAIFAGFVIAVLGGTRAQISGPTGAFIVIVYGIVQRYGYEGLVIATPVDIGGSVKSGDVVVRLDDRDARLRLDQAKALVAHMKSLKQ